TAFVSLKAKPNFRVLGKKVGKMMKQVQQEIDNFDQDTLEKLLNGQSVNLHIEGDRIEVTPDDVEVARNVHEGLIAANEGELTIALDTKLNDALRSEGLARELVNKINTMRRDLGFDVADRV